MNRLEPCPNVSDLKISSFSRLAQSNTQIHHGYAPLSCNSHFSKRTLRVWSSVSGLFHDTDDSDELRVQIRRRYRLNLIRRKSIAVPVEGQCKLVTVLGTCPTPTSDTFLSVPYLQSYFCVGPTARPFVCLGLLP